MNNKEKMLSELPYNAESDGLPKERLSNKRKIYEYNNLKPDEQDRKNQLIHHILGKCGDLINVEQPFHCDYGYNIEVGNNFYSNYNLTILDVAKVKIGENVLLGPNVSIYTAGHPLHPEPRNQGYEYGIGITIGDNVWIGGNAVINPGVSIGNNVVIGSGSVVTKDIPDNAIAVGNPCKVQRFISEEDKKYYYKNRKFNI